ncbi:hypothetical protein [Streptomyces sp. NPDC048106]|uniref:hypothetical protein n=1 Tax=Streptomyces sp. NPDC048106 TaxID=3155750 RepID=UPI0034554759
MPAQWTHGRAKPERKPPAEAAATTAPLTSEPPLPAAEPLTSEPPLADTSSLTSESDAYAAGS